MQRRVPTRADDDALGLSVLGDFPEPLVGRDSLIRRAERELAAAEATRSTAVSALRIAEAGRTLADTRHKGAEAQARLVEIDEHLRKLDETIADLPEKIGSARTPGRRARETHDDALVKLKTYKGIVEQCRQQLEAAIDDEISAQKKLDAGCRRPEQHPRRSLEQGVRRYRGRGDPALGATDAAGCADRIRAPCCARRPRSFARLSRRSQRGGGPRDYIADAQEERALFADQKAGKPVSFEQVAASAADQAARLRRSRPGYPSRASSPCRRNANRPSQRSAVT